MCKTYQTLAAYDYQLAHQAATVAEDDPADKLINVDILGHIFEQSISDLERPRNELDGTENCNGRSYRHL